MKTADIPRVLDYIDGLWDHRKLSEILRELLTDELAGCHAIPFEEACAELRRLRLGTGAFAPVEKIVEAVRLRDRQVAAGVNAQNAALASNRAARLHPEPVEDIAAEHEAAREFVRNLPQERLIELRDRVLRRSSQFVRMLVSAEGPEALRGGGGGVRASPPHPPVHQARGAGAIGDPPPPLDWANRDTITARLWVCMGLWMENHGMNAWSPVGAEVTR